MYAEIWKSPIHWTPGSHYKLVDDHYLGGGTFSDVYEGIDTDNNERIVVKFFKEERLEYVAQIEVKIQETLGVGPHV